MTVSSGHEITIAITVYDRDRYIREAIQSALNQTCPDRPKVIVVEDCGPRSELRDLVVNEFGAHLQYVRNPQRRGLFDNWNACIAACTTPWLCILHDDDVLETTFVESMLEVARAALNRGLYYGRCDVIDAAGNQLNEKRKSEPFRWHELDLESWTRHNPVGFPGQLFNVAAAKELKGFRPTSKYCADWEMWFKLALNYGAAATNRVVARYRDHDLLGRGTVTADLSGRKSAYTNMQRKRHVAWLKLKRPEVRFDRDALQTESPMPSRLVLQYGYRLSPRMLRYNLGLMYLSRPPHFGYRIFQTLGRILPSQVIRLFSWVFHRMPSRYDNVNDNIA